MWASALSSKENLISELGVGMGIYSALPKRKKLWGRRLAQFLIGVYLLVVVGIYMRENMQLEVFFLLPLGWYFWRVSHSLFGCQARWSHHLQSRLVRLGLLDCDGPGCVTLQAE